MFLADELLQSFWAHPGCQRLYCFPRAPEAILSARDIAWRTPEFFWHFAEYGARGWPPFRAGRTSFKAGSLSWQPDVRPPKLAASRARAIEGGHRVRATVEDDLADLRPLAHYMFRRGNAGFGKSSLFCLSPLSWGAYQVRGIKDED
jgi:hypothetical protein